MSRWWAFNVVPTEFDSISVEFDSNLPEFDSVRAEQGAVGIMPSSDEATPPSVWAVRICRARTCFRKNEKSSFPPPKSKMSRFCHAKNLEGTDFWG